MGEVAMLLELAPAKASVPPLTVVLPVYVLLAESNMLPLPVLVREAEASPYCTSPSVAETVRSGEAPPVAATLNVVFCAILKPVLAPLPVMTDGAVPAVTEPLLSCQV